MRATLLAAVVAIAGVAAARNAGAQDLVFDGNVPAGADNFFYLPFDVPAGTTEIEIRHLPAFLQGRASAAAASSSPATVAPETGPAPIPSDAIQFQIGTTVEEAEKGLIVRTLEHTRNNKTRAAEILGISLKTLHNKLKEYGAGKEFGLGV